MAITPISTEPLFAIGVYEGVGSPYNPNLPSQFQPAFLTLASSQYNLVWYPQIAPARQSVHAPPPVVGTDFDGQPTVRGYSMMTWTYPFLKPDRWYLLYNLFRLTRMNIGVLTGHVKIQWPDPVSGTPQIVSARWDTFSTVQRDMPIINNINLTFSHLAIDDTAVVGTWLPQ